MTMGSKKCYHNWTRVFQLPEALHLIPYNYHHLHKPESQEVCKFKKHGINWSIILSFCMELRNKSMVGLVICILIPNHLLDTNPIRIVGTWSPSDESLGKTRNEISIYARMPHWYQWKEQPQVHGLLEIIVVIPLYHGVPISTRFFGMCYIDTPTMRLLKYCNCKEHSIYYWVVIN